MPSVARLFEPVSDLATGKCSNCTKIFDDNPASGKKLIKQKEEFDSRDPSFSSKLNHIENIAVRQYFRYDPCLIFQHG